MHPTDSFICCVGGGVKEMKYGRDAVLTDCGLFVSRIGYLREFCKVVLKRRSKPTI